MNIPLKYIISCILLLALTHNLFSQKTLPANCDRYLKNGYVSTGQEYNARLDENNKAIFYTTFYGGSKYRIIACTRIREYPLIFKIYDSDKNLLFNNKDYNYTSYWDFTFTSTVDCIVEFEFDSQTHIKDEVTMLIGFNEK